MNSLLKRSRALLVTTLYVMASGFPAVADDTEIFISEDTTNDPTTANIVFILDSSGSMNTEIGGTAKIDLLKAAFEKVIFDTSGGTPDHSKANANIATKNIALMRFNGSEGGYFIAPMTTVTNTTVMDLWCAVKGDTATERCLDAENDPIAGISAGGNTPLAETLYEATRFYKAETPVWGGSNNVDGVTIGDVDDAAYISPLNTTNTKASQQCSSNDHIILMTDGMPTSDTESDTAIRSYAGVTSCNDDYGDDNMTMGNSSEESSCLDELAYYLKNGELITNKNKHVTTHTIAFDLQQDDAVALLRDTAINGGGEYREASDADSLAAAFAEIINTIGVKATTFVAPSVSVSRSNAYAHDKDIFYALFKPANAPKWQGNVKGYQIVDGQIRDFSGGNGVAALDNNSEFVSTAISRWGTEADGDKIELGGVAGQLTTGRTIYTYTGNNNSLSDESNIFWNGNGSIDNVDNLGIDSTLSDTAQAAERAAIIAWGQGLNSGGDLRNNVIGDPLHSQPIMVDYGETKGKFLFFGTNDGFLHAINVDDGSEKFAFIPRELLPNLKILRDNSGSATDHPYGVDGAITAWVNDANNDGEITVGNDSGDHVYIYFGLRRGGGSYYALDVTDITGAPKFLWQINKDTDKPDFERLGQTWSKPLLTRIKTGSIGTDSSGDNIDTTTVTDVLIFGGGYDTRQDTQEAPTSPGYDAGNAVYIVNAATGALVWKVTQGTPPDDSRDRSATELFISDMKYSIPSDIAAVDLDLTDDHTADRLYFGDMGGQLFRIDLNDTTTDSFGTMTYAPFGQVIADLSGPSGEKRRFYYAPDVALFNYGVLSNVLISIGSGYRAHPKSTGDLINQFYTIRDEYPLKTLSQYGDSEDPLSAAPIALITVAGSSTEYSLVNVTAQLTSSDTVFREIYGGDSDTTFGNRGWYINLYEEKVLAQATTASDYLLFTTYTPPPGSKACETPTGTGKLYVVSLFDGSKTSLTGSGRDLTLDNGGIPPSPLIYVEGQTGEDGENTPNPELRIAIGRQFIAFPADGGISLDKTYWQPVVAD